MLGQHCQEGGGIKGGSRLCVHFVLTVHRQYIRAHQSYTDKLIAKPTQYDTGDRNRAYWLIYQLDNSRMGPITCWLAQNSSGQIAGISGIVGNPATAWSHAHPPGHTPIVLVTHPSKWSHRSIQLVTHPSYWSPTHSTGQTPIQLVTYSSNWSHTHPSFLSHTHPPGHTP